MPTATTRGIDHRSDEQLSEPHSEAAVHLSPPQIAAVWRMSLFRIVVVVLVLACAAVVLSLAFNLLKAVLIVGAVGVLLGIGLALRPRRRPPAPRLDK